MGNDYWGAALTIIHQPWQINGSNWTISTVTLLIFVIIFGTMFAFWFYLDSLRYLKPKKTSLLGSLEPLSAVVTSVLLLQIPFGAYQ